VFKDDLDVEKILQSIEYIVFNVRMSKKGYFEKKDRKLKKPLPKIGDDMIISHLSTKRKDYNIERFERLFLRFDNMLAEYKKLNN
jgi:hypothetical protein